jgi:hypothetical protein
MIAVPMTDVDAVEQLGIAVELPKCVRYGVTTVEQQAPRAPIQNAGIGKVRVERLSGTDKGDLRHDRI